MTHRSLLASNHLLRNLSLVQLINYFALMFTQVALFTLLARNGAEALELALAGVIFWMPSILISPFSGVFVDRFSARLLMPLLLVVEIGATLLFLGFTQKEDFWFLMALLFVRSSAGVTYYTTTMSILPRVLVGESLKLANEIHSIIYSFCLTAGMALGGIVVNFVGIKEAFCIDAALYALGLALLIRTPFPKWEPQVQNVIDMLSKGAAYLLGSKKLLFIMATHAVVGTTLFDAIVTLLANNHYQAVIALPLAIGFINATRSLAAVIGPFIFSKKITQANLGYFLLCQALLLWAWSLLSSNFFTSLFGAFLAGILLTTLWSFTMTMLQESCDTLYFGRIIAFNDMIFTSTAVLSSIFIGFLLDSGLDERGAIALIGGFFALWGLVYIRMAPKFLDLPKTAVPPSPR